MKKYFKKSHTDVWYRSFSGAHIPVVIDHGTLYVNEILLRKDPHWRYKNAECRWHQRTDIVLPEGEFQKKVDAIVGESHYEATSRYDDYD